MKKTFNIYCDESCHLESDHKNYMLLGSVSSAYNQVKRHTQRIKDIKKKHNFYGEIKWSKVSSSKYLFYKDVIDYFFDTDLQFRAIAIDKSKIDHGSHDQDHDTFYYKMYYYMLNHNKNSLYNYNVYLDIKDTQSAHKVNRLKEILNTRFGIFKTVQNIRSHESILLQIADLIIGAISYLHNNEEKKVVSKMQLIEQIKKHSNQTLEKSSSFGDSKMNLFFIDLK